MRVVGLVAGLLALLAPVAPAGVVVRGGRPAERVALRSVLAAMPSTPFVRAELGPERPPLGRSGLMLSLDLPPRATRRARSDPYVEWQAWAVAAFYGRAPRVRPLTWLATPDAGSRIGDPAIRAPSRVPPVGSHVDVRALARDFAAASGAAVENVELVARDGRASAAITFRAADAATFIARWLLPFTSALRADPAVETTYVAVDDKLLGTRVYAGTASAVFHAGATMIDPRVESCSPFIMLGGVLEKPPPACTSA